AIVLRTFTNDNVPHIYNNINPMRDLESLNAELTLTDLTSVERPIERTTRAAKSRDNKDQPALEALLRLQSTLEDLQPDSQQQFTAQEQALLSELFLLILKPHMYIINVSEDVLAAANEPQAKIASGANIQIDTLKGELKGIAQVAQHAIADG